MINIILSVKQSFVKKDCFLRLFFNCISLKKLGYQHVVISDGSHWTISWVIYLIAKCFKYSYKHNYVKNKYSPSVIKNSAVNFLIKNNYSGYILFLDIDVFLNCKTKEYLINLMDRGVNFDWLPVIFLKENLKFWRHFNYQNDEFLLPKNIDQIGYVTGIQIFNIDFFVKLNKYDESFTGYGCEDIDMLHRSTYALGIRKSTSPEYYEDYRTKDLSNYRGFRKYFLTIKQDFDIEVMPIHFHHHRKNKSQYLRSRNTNDLFLYKKMRQFDNENNILKE